MNLNPFIELISTVIGLYKFALFSYIILELLIHFDIVNKYQYLISRVHYYLARINEPVLREVRKYIKPIGNIDLSPIIIFIALNFINSILFNYFYY